MPRDEDATGKHWLCAVCETLGLSIQRFVVSNTPAVVDLTSEPGGPNSQSLNGGPRRDSEPTNVRLHSVNSRNSFASFSEVRARRTLCRFCDLTTRAIERYSPDRIDGVATLSLRWEFDSWENAHERSANRTRRIRLAWHERNGQKIVVYLLFLGRTPMQPLSPSTGAGMASSPPRIATELDSATEKQKLVKSWVDDCVKNHEPRCRQGHGDRSEFRKLIKGTFFGVIDVQDMQLKQLPIVSDEPSQYVALSYVWGKKKTQELYVTKRSNVMLHIQTNGLQKAWDQLPKTIQDAILLVKQLGERYLWIDSLCIVQDSASSWELNAKSMHLVYGNAHLTICAADGDTDTGLLAMNEFPEEVQRRYPPLKVEVLPGVPLLATRPVEAIIQDSRWSQRGWTFQERLLSRRCLIFADRQLYFQCRSSAASQQTSTNGIAMNWSLDWQNSPLRTLRELQRKAFWYYMYSVTLYTRRHLTKSKDVLAAFSGVSWLLQEHMNAPLFYGLPMSHFDLALLWAPSDKLEVRGKRRRNGNEADCTEDMSSCGACRHGEEGYGAQFPSWSWAGWQGGKVEYRDEMLEGALANVQEWLKNHTWIRWYVRDREGNLRPLWDKDVLGGDRSEERSWRGYAGKPPSPLQAYNGSMTFQQRQMQQLAMQQQMQQQMLQQPARQQQIPRQQYGTMAQNFSPAGGIPRPPWLQTTQQPAPLVSPALANVEDAGAVQRQQTSGLTVPDSVAASGSPDYGPGALRRDHASSLNGPVPGLQQMYGNIPCRPDPCRAQNRDEPLSGTAVEPNPGYEESEVEDAYGRPLRETLKGRNTSDFTGILPDSPFGITKSPYPEDGKHHARSMPILQFWTWRAKLYINARTRGDTAPDTTGKARPLSRALVQCDIYDSQKDLCGAIALPSAGFAALSESAAASTPFHFIALSDAKAFTKEEFPEWNYYNERERGNSEWDLYFVMLLQENKATTLWERVAVGKVFQAAFRGAEWCEVKLG
ncbi:hypothetical protein ACHAQA_000267 [Verticillium albo-atrum]